LDEIKGRGALCATILSMNGIPHHHLVDFGEGRDSFYRVILYDVISERAKLQFQLGLCP